MTNVDLSLLQKSLSDPAQLIKSLEQAQRLKSGGNGPTSGGMEERVTRLETHMEYVRRDLDEIRGTLRDVSGKLEELPTKRDLDTWRWQWVGIATFVVALSVGAIAGGLSLITWMIGRTG